jgi:hypothetical protein
MAGPKYIEKYLAPGSRNMLLERVRMLRAQRKGSSLWQFSIPKESPLIFKENSDKLQADVTGIIWGEGDEVKEVRTLLRIWSLDEALCYRASIDAAQVRSKVVEIGQRVMVRFHFDCRVKCVTRPEPIYHLQVGGVALENENCWFPKQLDIPRFHFPPMDIVLLCELVLVNLFPKNSRNLREKPEWKKLVMKSQSAFQESYFNKFYSYVNSTTDTILGNLIS